jgi:hypothetical protein
MQLLEQIAKQQYEIKAFANNKVKSSLRKFLLVGSFYSLGEYFDWKIRDDLKSYK